MTCPKCPKCSSENTVKNGHIHNGKQKYSCKDCNRQFVENPINKTISEAIKALIDKLLLERISLAGISRTTGVSLNWLYGYVKKKYADTSRKLKVKKKKKGKLIVQMDELWSFVDNKGNKQWVWIAIDAKTREVIGLYIGDRSRESAQALWDSLPPVYRQCAVCYTDFWDSYEGVIPSKRHRAVNKQSGKTSYIERLNCTLRQRISRLVRKALSFSKSLENHIGAIWYFIHHYNESLSI
jgi:IS1 family transposase/transposase-like protein